VVAKASTFTLWCRNPSSNYISVEHMKIAVWVTDNSDTVTGQILETDFRTKGTDTA